MLRFLWVYKFILKDMGYGMGSGEPCRKAFSAAHTRPEQLMLSKTRVRPVPECKRISSHGENATRLLVVNRSQLPGTVYACNSVVTFSL